MQSPVTPVPFLDLTSEFKALEAEWFAAIREGGAAGAFVLGKNVAALETEIAAYVGVQHAVSVANGTDALILSLRALDIGAGDEVITTPFSFFATAEAITLVGATPVFVDIKPGEFNIDPSQIAARINAKTRAIMPVHLYGAPADMAAIKSLADKHKLAIVEDCAQAFGARIGSQCVGSFGTLGAFSFYPTKVLGCYGDGGMITTNDADLAARLRRLRNHGAREPGVHADIGYNSRLDEIQAALLRIKLKRIEQAIDGRRAVAHVYARALAGHVAVPSETPSTRHAYNVFTIRHPARDTIRALLAEQQIPASLFYPHAIHRQPVYAHLGYAAGSLPRAEAAAREVLSLPIFPGLDAGRQQRVVEGIVSAIAVAA